MHLDISDARNYQNLKFSIPAALDFPLVHTYNWCLQLYLSLFFTQDNYSINSNTTLVQLSPFRGWNVLYFLIELPKPINLKIFLSLSIYLWQSHLVLLFCSFSSLPLLYYFTFLYQHSHFSHFYIIGFFSLLSEKILAMYSFRRCSTFSFSIMILLTLDFIHPFKEYIFSSCVFHSLDIFHLTIPHLSACVFITEHFALRIINSAPFLGINHCLYFIGSRISLVLQSFLKMTPYTVVLLMILFACCTLNLWYVSKSFIFILNTNSTRLFSSEFVM